MPRFIATHTAPFTEEQLKAAAKEVASLPPGVAWKLTYCDFADGKFFCEWEAPNKEIVEKGFKTRNMPFDAVYPVQLFDVARGELKD
jgi:hypothetical protein